MYQVKTEKDTGQCCGAGLESRGAEIKLPRGNRSQNYQLRLRLFSIYQSLEEILKSYKGKTCINPRPKVPVQVKKDNFSRYHIKPFGAVAKTGA